MIQVQDSLDCCGINELTPIQDYKYKPEQTIKEACFRIFEHDNTGAFIIFSDTGQKTAGRNLAKYIKEKKLGTTIKTKPSINPNSGRSLQVWIWKINQNNLKKFWQKNRIRINIYE